MNASERFRAHVARLRGADGIADLSLVRGVNDDGTIAYRERLDAVRDGDVADAWAALAAVREIRPAVLDAVETVLRETVLDPLADRPALPALTIAPPPSPHKPTAANPRAYKGTRDRPPKPRRPEPMDLRPFLCLPGAQDRLVDLLVEHAGPVDLPDEARDAPPAFLRGFAWSARRTRSGWNDALARHRRLDLDRDTTLHRALLFLFAPRYDEHALRWLDDLVHVLPEHRLPLVHALAAYPDAIDATPSDGSPVDHASALTAVDALSTSDNYPSRARFLARVIAAGASPASFLPAFALANAHEPSHDFDAHAWRSERHAPCDANVVLQFCERTFPEPTADAMDVWHAACREPLFVRILRALLAHDLNGDLRQSIAHVLAVECLGDDGLDWDATDAAEIERYLGALTEIAPDYREDAADLLCEIVRESSLDDLPEALSIARRLYRHPFPLLGHSHIAGQSLAALEPEFVETIVGADDRSFELLHHATRRRNDAWLVAYGIESLESTPTLLTAGFVRHPGPLLRVAATLGSLSLPAAERVVLEIAGESSPLGVPLADLDAAALVALFDEHGPKKSGASPVPKKLRAHLAGTLQLGPAQIERAAAKIRDAWPAVVLDRIAERCLEELGKSLGTDDVDVEALNDRMLHAIRLQAGLEENQRGLRRLMRAYHRGDVAFAHTHPANAAWLAKQPARIAAHWITDLVLEREVTTGTPPSRKRARLAVEHDPLEALRLGTYAGSCLGLGGSFTDSAAAVVIDVNKQVVFARDANGAFLARQIIAITTAGELACYPVYPKSTKEVRRAFADFDRRLADRLGVSLADPDDDPDVEEILAAGWWNDGAWRPGKSEAPRST